MFLCGGEELEARVYGTDGNDDHPTLRKYAHP